MAKFFTDDPDQCPCGRGVPGNENIVDGKIMCDYCHCEKLAEDKSRGLDG